MFSGQCVLGQIIYVLFRQNVLRGKIEHRHLQGTTQCKSQPIAKECAKNKATFPSPLPYDRLGTLLLYYTAYVSVTISAIPTFGIPNLQLPTSLHTLPRSCINKPAPRQQPWRQGDGVGRKHMHSKRRRRAFKKTHVK